MHKEFLPYVKSQNVKHVSTYCTVLGKRVDVT